MEKNFNESLYKKYRVEVIRKFVEEFEEEVSCGELISYINLKMNEEFRNRDFIKLLRRMDVEGQKIKVNKFYRYFGK